ncbi:YceI family protein [Crocinitomix sp.]|nr:YceI family protein [Crocinitomix sp.]
MLKKVIIALVVLVIIGLGVIFMIPWGEYESTLEKSEVEQEVATDSSGNLIPTLTLLNGDYAVKSGEESQAEILFDVDGLKTTKGAFEKFSILFNIPADYSRSTLIVEIESNSINTGNEMRDEHLVDPDFFDVKNFPIIKFQSSEIEEGDTSYIAHGELSLLDQLNKIDVPFKHLGKGVNTNGADFEAFEGKLTFDRTEYGMEEVSGAGNVVTVSFYCELLKQ